jgi:hypothetical protein
LDPYRADAWMLNKGAALPLATVSIIFDPAEK